MNITEQEMREFAGKFFPGKELHWISNDCIQVQAGTQFGIPMHYEYHVGTIALHLEQNDWRAIRNYLNANLKNERLTSSSWYGRNNGQWTINNEIHNVQDLFQAFLDIRSIIEPVIEQFEGKEPQDYSRYTLDEAKEQPAEPKKEAETMSEVAKETATKNEKVKCPNCGAESVGKFCPECGTPLQKMSSRPQSEVKMKGTGEQKMQANRATQTEKTEERINKQANPAPKPEQPSKETALHTQLEEKIRAAKQVTVARGHWRTPDEQGVEFQIPEHEDLWNMDEWSLKNLLVSEIENAARKVKGEDVEDCLSVLKGEVRAIRNLSELTGNAKISKGKMIFSYSVEKFIDRWESDNERYVGTECDKLSQRTSYASKYDAPYLDSVSNSEQAVAKAMKEINEVMAVNKEITSYGSNAQIFSYEIHRENSRPCTKCNGEKIEHCPKCDGSGREQYIDSYFASGEPKYKTGQCSKCYGKGFITCRHCDGTGLEDKGTGVSAVAKTYKEKVFYKKYFSYITPWFSDVEDCTDFSEMSDLDILYTFGWYIKYYNFLKSRVRNDLTLIHTNQNELFIDQSIAKKDELLNQIGYEYSNMYDALQEKIREQNEDSDGKTAWVAQNFLTCDIYKIDYEVGGEEYSICVIVDGNNHACVDWDGLPEMGLFGGIKKNR